MTDCEEMKYASTYVKEWLNRQPNVKEDTLTDWLLMQISYKINRVIYHSFTRNEEARLTGADWEWWFLYPHIAYRFRIQAKKIYTNNYDSLNYTNKHGKQIDQLISDAKNKNFIPLYAFYTNGVNNTTCRKKIKDEGIYLANAMELEQALITPFPIQKNITDDDILKYSIPLSCILCCNLIQKDGFDIFIDEYFKTTPSLYSNYPNLGRYDNIPPYITTILEHQGKELPDWFRKEFKFEDVNAIMIVDNRKNI